MVHIGGVRCTTSSVLETINYCASHDIPVPLSILRVNWENPTMDSVESSYGVVSQYGRFLEELKSKSPLPQPYTF